MSKKASLLIVDDDEDMLETLSDILQEKGYRTETARTGMEAIVKVSTRYFDVALIDIRLPDLTGIELLRTLREKHPSIICIIITGHSTTQNAVEALNLGASAYVTKPIDAEKLHQMIRKRLGRAHVLLP